MKTVKEVSKLTGVSVRTLHHNDAIGLLPPSHVTEAGSRLYDDQALEKLHTILFLRQLEFPLKEIRQTLSSPDFDPVEAVQQQIRLLQLKKEHLEKLISHAKMIQKTGVIPMNFKPFDTSKIDEYSAQAKARWGATEAYREYEQKTKGQTKEQMQSTGGDLMDIFARMGTIRHTDPASPEAQAMVKALQDFITAHYYTCTKQILQGLGMMYIAGDSMTENIDAAGGEGTADFAHRAIEIYCRN